MKRRTFFGLAVITLITAAAAIVAELDRPTAARVETAGLLFPQLAGRVNDVATITIESKDAAITLQRAGDGWVLVEKDDYPVRFEKVRKALVALTELEAVERRTRDPARYGRLQVRDIEAEGSASKLLTLKDRAGKVLGRLIVGKWQYRRGGVGSKSVYVRKAGDAQSWLARGNLEIYTDPLMWLRRQVLDLPTWRLESVSVDHADGQRISLRKDAPTDADFSLESAPEGAALKAYRVGAIARTAAGLDLADVRRRDEVVGKFDSAGAASYRTFDGLIVDLALYRDGEDIWFTVAARAEPPASLPEAPRLPAAEGEAAATEKVSFKSAREVTAEAADINARSDGWAYREPTTTAKDLLAGMDDLIRSDGGS